MRISSNERLYKKILSGSLVVFSALVMVACMKPESRVNSRLNDLLKSDESATFLVDDISGSSKVADTHSLFKTPLSKLYNFSACVRDRHSREAISGFTFKITGVEGDARQAQSDSRGCLTWSEKVKYDFLADPKYLALEIAIEAVGGGHSGTRHLPIAVNPWATGSDEIIDLNKQTLPDQQLATESEAHARMKLSVSSRNAHPIVIDDMSFEHKLDSGKGSQITLTFTPKLLLNDINGAPTPYAFQAGRFQVTGTIVSTVESHGKRIDTPLATVPKNLAPKDIHDGVVSFTFDPELKAIPREGMIEFIAQVTPVSGPKGLSSFEGRFVLGDASFLTGSRGTTQRPIESNATKPGFTAAQALASGGSSGAGGANVKVGGGSNIVQKVAFEIDHLAPDPPFSYPAESSTTRTIRFGIKTCLRDPSDPSKVLRDMPVTIIGGTEQPSKKTDPNGCIKWFDEISHDYYTSEKYVRKTYTIRSERGDEQSRTLIINPWEDGFSMYFAYDSEDADAQAKQAEANPQQLTPTTMLIPGFRFDALPSVYSVDHFLNLRVLKKYTMTIQPIVIRPTLRRGENVVGENLRRGAYLLKAAIRRDIPGKEGGPNSEAMTVVKQLVAVNGSGLIQAEIAFPFRELGSLSVVNQLLIELNAVDESKIDLATLRPLQPGAALDSLILTNRGFPARTYVGPFVPDEVSNFRASMRPTDALTESYCESFNCNELKVAGQPLGEVVQQSADDEKFYGGLQHLANTTVTQLIPRYIELETKYASEVKSKATIPAFLAANNSELVAMNDASATKFLAGLQFEIPKYGFMWRQSSGPISSETLNEWLNGRAMTDGEMVRLYIWWMRTFIPSMLPADRQLVGNLKPEILIAESRQADGIPLTHNPSAFTLDQKLFVDKVASFTVVDADNAVYHVAAESGSEAKAERGWEVSGHAGVPIASVFGLGAGAKYGKGVGFGRGSGLAVGKDLSMERTDAKIKVSSYQKCALIRLNPEFMKASAAFRMHINPKLPADVREKVFSRGIMICSGQFEKNVPLEIAESYYYYFSSPPAHGTRDYTDPRAQKWNRRIRGASENYRFLSILEATPTSMSKIESDLNIHNKPFDMLKDAYRFATPTYPGVYNFAPDINPTSTEN